MIYSRTAKYGIKALVYLSGKENGDYSTVSSVADRTDIPAEFLGKIFQELARRGILESRKGRGGGFRLRRPGDEISLLEVVETLDGEDVFNDCLFDVKKCGRGGTCPLHDEWVPVREEIKNFLAANCVADLANE